MIGQSATCFHHVTPSLQQLHWLPIVVCALVKVMVLICFVYGSRPQWTTSHLHLADCLPGSYFCKAFKILWGGLSLGPWGSWRSAGSDPWDGLLRHRLITSLSLSFRAVKSSEYARVLAKTLLAREHSSSSSATTHLHQGMRRDGTLNCLLPPPQNKVSQHLAGREGEDQEQGPAQLTPIHVSLGFQILPQQPWKKQLGNSRPVNGATYKRTSPARVHVLCNHYAKFVILGKSTALWNLRRELSTAGCFTGWDY